VTTFSITWDYRCPFARNAHEHVLAGMAAGADWDVRFVPFSLAQSHVSDGMPDVWDAPETDSGLLALSVGVSVRDQQPDHFLAVHAALFSARHDRGLNLRDRSAVLAVAGAAGADVALVEADLDSGRPLKTIQTEHSEVAASHQVWGVPTFMNGSNAVFVRLMNRPDLADASPSIRSIERVVDMVSDWPELNEFKHTSISR
jgi:2-hydroxychromene-2-carboxylate isomerase